VSNPLLEPGRRLIIAHRGASAEAPENTLEAFQLGLDQGADALEMDVRLTQDGEAVVIHDPTLDRTTDRGGVVAELTLQQVQAARAGGGGQIPTFRSVLEAFPAHRCWSRSRPPRRRTLSPSRSSARRPRSGGHRVVSAPGAGEAADGSS
jgi:hypothetical protein